MGGREGKGKGTGREVNKEVRGNGDEVKRGDEGNKSEGVTKILRYEGTRR